VLEGVTFTLEPGKVTVVAGPNGSGKTTLLRLLLGLLRPTSGRATLDGRDLHRHRPADRAARLAYVPQRAHVAFPFSVRQVVALGRRNGSGEAAEEALRRVGLADAADRPFHELSAGQQQRVALARAVCQLGAPAPPGVTRALLADEPTAALDPAHAFGAMELLGELASAGLTVVVVLHDLTLAERYAHHAIVLDQTGRVAAHGPARGALDPGVLGRVFGVRFVKLGDAKRRALVPVSEPPDTL